MITTSDPKSLLPKCFALPCPWSRPGIHCTHLVVVGNVDDDGQPALVGAVVDEDHAPDLHKASETLQKPYRFTFCPMTAQNNKRKTLNKQEHTSNKSREGGREGHRTRISMFTSCARTVIHK